MEIGAQCTADNSRRAGNSYCLQSSDGLRSKRVHQVFRWSSRNIKQGNFVHSTIVFTMCPLHEFLLPSCQLHKIVRIITIQRIQWPPAGMQPIAEPQSSTELQFSAAEEAGNSCSTSGREYLAYFLHRHLDFRLPEIDSLIELAGQGKASQSRWRQPFGGHFYSPFWYLQLPSDAVAHEVAERSILLKVSLCFMLHDCCLVRVACCFSWQFYCPQLGGKIS